MSPDLRPDPPTDGPTPALTLANLSGWMDRLAGPDALPDAGGAHDADAAGLQLLVSALLWAPGRLSLDPVGDSPVSRLWHRLGLDDPADAEVVTIAGRVTALRACEASQ